MKDRPSWLGIVCLIGVWSLMFVNCSTKRAEKTSEGFPVLFEKFQEFWVLLQATVVTEQETTKTPLGQESQFAK